MKTTWKIAKVELSSLFYSPIPWVLLIIFAVQGGLDFTHMMEMMVNMQMERGPGNLSDITSDVFTNLSDGVYSNTLGRLYLYVPLLTMGLMSREFSSGSIKLLLSSPVRMSEIVMGKFVAIMLYWLLPMAMLLLYFITGHFTIEAMEWRFLLSCLLGIYLLAGVYSALGLFLSCLTSYVVVAAIGTLIALAFLDFMSDVWQGIPFVRDLTGFINLSGHTWRFKNGLIVSRDLFYFLIMTTLFLGLSVLWLQGMTDSRSRWFKVGRYLSLVTVLLLLGYISSRPAFTFYYDATVTRRNTITPETQALIKKVKKPLKVAMYANLFQGDAELGFPEMLNKDMAWWDNYIRFMPEMQFDYINYYDSVMDLRYYTDQRFRGLNLAERAKKIAYDRDHDLDLYLPPDEIHKRIDLRPELNLFVRQLEDSGGRHRAFLRMFHDPMHTPSETEVATAIKRLGVTPPKVVFVTGHSERSIDKKEDRSYRAIAHDPGERGGLINQGFDVDSITLDQDLPAGIAALVIADPTHPYTQDELQKIQRYIAAGGNLLVIGQQGHQAVLNPLLKPLGVQLMEGMLVANSTDLAPDGIFVRVADSASLAALGLTDNWLSHGPLLYAPGSVALRYTGNGPFDVHPFLLTDGKNTWNKLGAFQLDTGNVSYNPEHGDDHSPLPVALALTRKMGDKEQRIMVLGNANWMDNEYLGRQRMVKTLVFNFSVAREIFKWFSRGEFPLSLSRKQGKDTTMLITRTGLRPLTIFFQWVLPGLLLVFGTTLLIRRKRK